MSRTIVRAGAIAIAAIALLAVSALAFEWPADAGKFRYGFGTPRDGFLRGIEFGSNDGLALAADDGEMTFSAVGASLPGGYPLPGGSLIAVAHPADMMTIYAGLRPDSVSSYLKNVRKGDILGRSSSAGASRGATFYAFDARERRFINPLILMPTLIDDKPPVIRSVSLSMEGAETRLDQSKAVRQGSYYFLIDAYDSSPAGEASSPFDLRVLIDGSERERVVYDAAWASAGKANLFGGASRGEDSYLAGDGRIRLGPYSLSRGRVVISVAVSDYASNKREQTYSITVQ